ncbi:MAG: PIN domain-containing protein [Candidatus Diapherotrites archaeon]|nr:PIN domain-containing protein [Candidatus Diapherotrites archaeon]
MNIVVDANIVMAALIKDSFTRNMLLKSEYLFYFPEPALTALKKYKPYLIKKSELTEFEFTELVNLLFEYISIIPTQTILPYLNQARKSIGFQDKEDIVILASAFSIPNSVIWSNDVDFEKQTEIIVFKTKDLANLSFK